MKLTGMNYQYLYVVWTKVTHVECSNIAADLAEIKNFLIEKSIDISKMKFTGLDGMSAMSSNKVWLQQCLQYFSPYSILQKLLISSVFFSLIKTVLRAF